MPRWVLVAAVVLVALYLFMRFTQSGQRMAGQFPYPVPPLFGVNRGGGVPGL